MIKFDTTKKEERHTIYILALECYRKAVYAQIQRGLCSAIYNAIFKIYNNTPEAQESYKWDVNCYADPYNGMEGYPEILKHKPISHGIYWFDRYDIEGINKRIAILEEAIQLTHPLNNK